MPYEIKNVGGSKPWVLKKKGVFGRVLGRHKSKEGAEKQLRAVEANTHGK